LASSAPNATIFFLAITQQGYQSDIFHVVFANADECDMDEESLRHLLCSSGTSDGARGLIHQDAWDLAIYLYTVTDRKQFQGLRMECTAAPTVCACVFGRDCSLNREGTILAAEEKYNRAASGKPTHCGWEAVLHYVNTHKNALQHTCVWGKSFASVYALKNHVAEGWVGSSHGRSPECRPRLGIAYIISDASHLNPYQSVLAAHAIRVVSRSSDDEPSTSVKEQCVTAAMGILNRIAADNCEVLLSSDSLSGLMALKKVCMYPDLTARHGVRTKEAGVLGLSTLHIRQMCARGADFGTLNVARSRLSQS